MAQLRLYLLGPPRLESDDVPVGINRRKAMALLCYLATGGDSHSRDKLATLLWPDASQRQARAALRSALWDLNKTPLGAYLEVEAEAIRLRATSSTSAVEPDLWLDVTRFQECLAFSQSHNHPAGAICPTCLEVLTEAASLYRDDFLAGFNLPDCPDFDEWQFFQTESLRQGLATALERLIQLHQAQNEPAAAIPHARRRLALDPLHEPAHHQLMLLYAQSGQQSAALRQYEECARLLKEELGVSPSAETKALYENIKARRISPLAEAAEKGKKGTEGIRGTIEEQSKIQTLGRYELLSEMGRGGFAIAYRARDTELDRIVALKVLRSRLMEDADWVSRFRREARAIARLDHPRIVTVHDIGEAEGRLFIVMRLIDGPDLAALIANRGHLPWPEAVEIIEAVTEGLDYAHRQGILHRDLKPANILMDPERGPLLSDFGLAKLMGEHSLSQQGDIVGTPHYIAPELWEGQPASIQSDIYALGCILYELLTGEKLFKGVSPLAVMMAHFSPPELPQAWPEGIPSGVTEILKSALANQPAERYTTAGEIVKAMAALAAGTVAEQEVGEQPFDRLRVRSGEGEEKSPSRTPAPLPNLPAQITPFIGREKELADLATLMANPNLRLITILGPGGMGKTRLALETAVGQITQYRQGVYFVPLAPLSGSESIITTIAEVVNYPFQTDHRSPRQQLLDYFRQKQILLVLDNFEHLLEGADLVDEILQAAPEVKVLVTSRERLKFAGETVFTLSGMDFPDDKTSKDTLEYNAVKLFVQSAQQTHPDFAPETDDLHTIGRICRLVQGMPLGIVLAAAWIEMLSPQEILNEISQSFDFLETELRNVPERQRSIRAVFNYSWRLLAKAEGEIFIKLSVFRGGFSRQAAQSVTGSSLQTLTALVNKSLLQRNSSGRYEIHELLRQYAEEQLNASRETETAHEAHCAYYIDFLYQREADLKGHRQLTTLNEIQADSENARAAWQWAVMRGQSERVEQAMETLGLFYEVRGHYQEGKAAFQFAAETVGGTGTGDNPRLLARLLGWQSVFSRSLEDIASAGQLLQQGLELLGRPELSAYETRPEKAFLLLQMGRILRLSDNKQAMQSYEQVSALFQALDNRWGRANTLEGWGFTAKNLGDYEQARQLFEESLTLREILGDHRGVARSLLGLGSILTDQGELEEAENLIRKGLVINQELDNRAGLAFGFQALTLTSCFLGKFAEALLVAEEGLSIYENLGNHASIGILTMFKGFANLHLGQYKQARTQLQLALTIAQETDNQGIIARSLWLLGQVALAETSYREAKDRLQESLSIFRKTGLEEELGRALATLGLVAHGQNNIPQMQQYLAEALQIAVETRAFTTLLEALSATTRILIHRDEPEQVVEIYALTSRYPYVANSRWFEDAAGRQIAAVAATLPPEVVEAVQARGRARDLWVTARELLAELEE